MKETIYIAGPECFFENGKAVLGSMRNLSESQGHDVSLPNDDPLKMDHEDLQLNAHSIFENLKKRMLDTTMIISDLDQFRGAEPDSGTIYEMGMAYALNLKIYGHTRDMRPLVWKDQKLVNHEGVPFDEHNHKHYYSFLPFSPMIMASTRLVEGNFEDTLTAYQTDKYFPFSHTDIPKASVEESSTQKIFVASRNYYDEALLHEELKGLKEIDLLDYEIVTPYFEPYDFKQPVGQWLKNIINENTKRVDQCEVFVGDLNDYRGYECSNDVAFLCGYAFQTGKKLYGYMADTRPMIEKIPNIKVEDLYKDLANRDVENFNYPINLMFACSMEIFEGDLKDCMLQILEEQKSAVN